MQSCGVLPSRTDTSHMHECKPNLIRSLIGLNVIGILGCGDVAQPTLDETRIGNALPSDQTVLNKIYDSNYRVPENFYVDDRAHTPRSYSVYHVTDPSNSYERCTDDIGTAQRWEEASNSGRAVSGVYVGAIDNERYFEFIRELSYEDDVGNVADLTSPGFARVFKCSYINRDGVDRQSRDGYAGMLTVRSAKSETLENMVQYLWQFTFFWPEKAVVLATFSTEHAETLEHTLQLATRTVQGTDRCDRIDVVDWTFEMNRADATIQKRFEMRHRFEAQSVGGEPAVCEK